MSSFAFQLAAYHSNRSFRLSSALRSKAFGLSSGCLVRWQLPWLPLFCYAIACVVLDVLLKFDFIVAANRND